ncbi:uncharacterized protein LOC107423396 isoform X1 [Ziziphus jujuba]|uniref:Uncharacterized protein LOC107423396 isoform X1 n=1 Tax=Ziziphus jujuba TaxID=326968 RepID=A0ABM4A5H6_ZIZJJ|nr:uncharacterized protein LOC107423396 isoform X1 [Ziziphus jujuba]
MENFCSLNNKYNCNNNKKKHKRSIGEGSVWQRKKRKRIVGKKALVDLKHLGVPLVSATSGSPSDSIILQPDRPYTIGRSSSCSHFVFDDRRVGRRHCQILFDALLRKLYILDGALLFTSAGGGASTRGCVLVQEFRKRLLRWVCEKKEVEERCSKVRASLNGVFVNGVRVNTGMAVELSAGDEVSLVCGNEGLCGLPIRIGFVIRRIVFEEELLSGSRPQEFFDIVTLSSSHSQGSKRVFASKVDGFALSESKCENHIARVNRLLSQCNHILLSDDPISCIRACVSQVQVRNSSYKAHKRVNGLKPSEELGFPILDKSHIDGNVESKRVGKHLLGSSSNLPQWEKEVASVPNIDSPICVHEVSSKTALANNKKFCGNVSPSPGRNFYLNRLGFMDDKSSGHHSVISLPELLYPVESIARIFIATFTSDILWFLSSCNIPSSLPVTIACHNSERCWSTSPDKRSSVPYPDFPNLIAVYPPFPEDIAFGKDSKKQGIACHHPKFFVLQRDNSLRVIITSANLVPSQWNAVTNTIWWQDFPCRTAPDYLSLFTQLHDGETEEVSKSDFASQLAGFMASLVTDVPSQAHWITELTKYDFGGAVGYLIASVPGMHLHRTPSVALGSSSEKFLGLVEASVVGLSHLFHKKADSNGAQLKKLASFLLKSCINANVLLEIVLIRSKNVPADANAVSILVPNPTDLPKEDCIQLGFLPRKTAKWVSPLWDIGFFQFSAYICPKDALAAALGESIKKVPLSLHVYKGSNFQDISKIIQPEHATALCSLIASIQRPTGLWRLQEVLGQYKWPESLESDFIYGSSSIGSLVNAPFLAAFSAAAGKRSFQFESEESDPGWGCWNACQELKSPSIRIIFPTIKRVKYACGGVLPSKRILCFSERTWERLRTIDILHDAVPHPQERVGHPMHSKQVARRRFQSRTDASSFGWVYCGSHNFSAAAWGRPFGEKANEPGKANSLGSRLHVCNYELGIVFIFPPTEAEDRDYKDSMNLDDIVLPFVVPAPKYGPTDRPATARAMREALTELSEQDREKLTEVEEIPDEEDESDEATDFDQEEKEEEKAYAETLWNHIDSSQSC